MTLLLPPFYLKDIKELQKDVENAWQNPDLLKTPECRNTLDHILKALERGALRVAGPQDQDANCGPNVAMDHDLKSWQVFSWVKQAILLAFRQRTSQIFGQTPRYFDKLRPRVDAAEANFRVVPPGVVREGAYVAEGAIIMPGFVNVGAFVGTGTMVDTWATVGSCAQVGRNVHLAGGVGIGGVLEPPSARPVLIGDECFVGSRCIIVEGTVISERAVLGANVCLTANTPVYDVTQSPLQEYRGFVPPRAIVAPGTRIKSFPGGEVPLQCAYIIGYRSEKTDAKVSLNDALRETGLAI